MYEQFSGLANTAVSAYKSALGGPLRQKAMKLQLETIRPVLEAIQKESDRHLAGLDAEELLLGTAIKESGLNYRRQLNGGPALGLFQMESATHDDIWQNFIEYRKPLKDAMLHHFNVTQKPDATRLVDDDSYAAIMARIRYARVPGSLPPAGDLRAQAQYWKANYNTSKGKGTVEEYLAAWHRIMGL
jgi:hypothetical protein